MKFNSPITNSTNTSLKTSIPVKTIIDLYKKDFDIDVARFFLDLEFVSVVECLDTGYVFFFPYSVFGDEKFYDDLKRQMPARYNVPYYPSWKWEFEICAKMINPLESVYEIGCGAGYFLDNLIKKGIKEVFGTELNQASVEVARSKGLTVDRMLIEDKAKTSDRLFDVVCAFQVLEHIADVKAFLDASLQILKQNGKLMIAVPYNDPYLFRNDMLNTLNMPPHHMGLWNRKSFENLGKFYPLVLEQILVESLPGQGYDFDRYFEVNKDKKYSPKMPFKKLYDKLYYRWLKRSHKKHSGKNIIAIFSKK